MARTAARLVVAAALSLAFTFASSHANAAETVHLYLKVNGADVKGESTQLSLGRDGSIECVAYEQAVETAREPGATGTRRQYPALRIVKRIDRSSPHLYRALVLNQPVDATFKFFRPNPTGDGTTQQFYTVTIKNARISTIKVNVPSTLNPATSNQPPTEEVAFVFGSISWTYVGEKPFEDAAAQPR